MAAAGAGAPPPQTLFQIGFPDGLAFSFGRDDLWHAKQYAGDYDQVLFNCINISLVYLRLIKNPGDYLETCASRHDITLWGEMSETLRKAVGTEKMAPLRMGETILPLNVSFFITPEQRLREIGQHLAQGYATLIALEYANGNIHVALLRRTQRDGTLLYIDPQIKDQNGSWPLIRTPNSQRIPRSELVRNVYYFVGPIIPRGGFQLGNMRYDPTALSGNAPLMKVNKPTNGGRSRKARRTKRRSRTRLNIVRRK